MNEQTEKRVKRAVESCCREADWSKEQEQNTLRKIRRRIAAERPAVTARTAGMTVQDNKKGEQRGMTRQRTGKSFRRRTAILVAAAVLALGSLTAFAAGRVMGISTHTSREEAIRDVGEVRRQAEKAFGVPVAVPDSLGEGFAFVDGYVTEAQMLDAEGNTIGIQPTAMVNYGAVSDEGILMTVDRASEDGTFGEPVQRGGQTFYTSELHYLLLPPDAEPSAEERALQEAGELVISYGAPERTRKLYRSVYWTTGDLSYLLTTSGQTDLETLLTYAETAAQ